MKRELDSAGAPLVLRCYSAGTPLVAEKNVVSKRSASGTPSVLRRSSAGAPPRTVRKTKRTTYPSDRYDFPTSAPPINLIHLVMETNTA